MGLPWNRMKRRLSRGNEEGAEAEGDAPHRVKLVQAARSWERDASQKHLVYAKAD
jgi:hypothetical protein